MKNVISGYRKMTGLTQQKMAKKLSIGVTTYHNKEVGISEFTQNEMLLFYSVVHGVNPNIGLTDIFFTDLKTK